MIENNRDKCYNNIKLIAVNPSRKGGIDDDGDD